jgi:DNA-binding transcriptional MerR regulator
MVRRASDNTSVGLVKLYYRIGEVSRLVGVAPHVLRYWETEFRTVRPQKSSHGQRVYSKKDVQKLLTIKDLLKSQGFTIEGARKRLRELPLKHESDGRDTVSSASPPVEGAGSVREVSPVASAPSAKPLRAAMLEVRADLVAWLGELTLTEQQRF